VFIVRLLRLTISDLVLEMWAVHAYILVRRDCFRLQMYQQTYCNQYDGDIEVLHREAWALRHFDERSHFRALASK
jgi:hypothetical protein